MWSTSYSLSSFFSKISHTIKQMYSQLKIIQAIFMPCYWSFNQVVHCTLCNFTTKDAKNEFCLLSQVICHGYLLQTCQASVLTRLNTIPNVLTNVLWHCLFSNHSYSSRSHSISLSYWRKWSIIKYWTSHISWYHSEELLSSYSSFLHLKILHIIYQSDI